MTAPHHRIFSRSQVVLAAILFAVALPRCVLAAVSQGPIATNAAAAKDRRITEFYRAEQSFQEQRQVGQKRYDEKQAARAQRVAAMSAELQSRQQTVVMPPVADSFTSAKIPAGVSRPWMALAVFAIVFSGLIYYWNRQRSSGGFGRS